MAATCEVDRLLTELALVPDGRHRARADQLLQDAKNLLAEGNGPIKWWTGQLVEHTWTKLFLARETLLLAQDDAAVRAQLPYLLTLVASGDTATAQALSACGTSTGTLDRSLLHQVLVDHHVATSIRHTAVRKFRNTIYLMTLLVAIVMGAIAGPVEPMLRLVMGIGALAGLATSVVTFTTATAVPGPFSVVLPQALLKMATGALTALLAVVLLVVGGFAELKTGSRGALAYAVIFGFSQQALTRLVDGRVKGLASQ